MKQRVVVAMLAVAVLLCTSPLSAQSQSPIHNDQTGIAISFGPTSTIGSYCLDQNSTVYTSIYVRETEMHDFYGDGGNTRPIHDFYIQLPEGFYFIDNTPNALWDVNTSADLVKLQSGPTSISFIGSNIFRLANLQCKNTVQLDEILLYNLRITTDRTYEEWVDFVNHPDEERNKFKAWIGNPQNYPPFPLQTRDGLYQTHVWNIGSAPTRVAAETDPIYRHHVKHIPTFTPPTFAPGIAEGIVFVIQPSTGPFDVQQRIAGSAPGPWPTLQAVDCSGFPTTSFPSTNLTPNVNLVLVGPSTSGLWYGDGPTYVGAAKTINPSSAWSNGRLSLQVSVEDARQVLVLGSYQIEATSNLVPSTYGTSKGVSNIATSTAFAVKKRAITFASEPMLPDMYDVSMNNMFMPIYGDGGINSYPESDVRDVAGMAAQGIRATLAMHPNTVTAIPFNTSGEIIAGRYQETVISPLNGFAQFVGLNPATGPGFTVDQSELNNSLAVNFFTYVPTKYFGIASTLTTPSAVSPEYLDPRYIVPSYHNVSVTPLPVELISFTALVRNQAVQLKWSTATETNNYGFDVERSLDGTSWEKLGFVAGFGTTSSQRDYGYTNKLSDADMLQRTISYRLRQIDRDGTVEYSPVVTVALASAATNMTLLQNFPNPFNPSTNISFNLPESGAVTLTVFNELGVEVARIHDGAQLEAGWHTASFNASALPSGVYMYRLQTGGGSTMRTMIVSK
jgi:hypothetical protein